MSYSGDELITVRLNELCSSKRFRYLDRLDSYLSGTQYDHLSYDWDGHRTGYAGEADIAPGWYVPLKRRKPSYTLSLGKLIVNRLTAMLLGEERFPEICVPGDPDAEDYVRAIVEESKIRTRLQEARDKGGACGTACMSFAFVEGRPRVQVHRAKHMHVLEWRDRYEHRPAVALKSYVYTRTIWVGGRSRQVDVYYARLWTETSETLWDPIPHEQAITGEWVTRVPSHTVRHDYGECPVYWAQNLPDCDEIDGVSDYACLTDDFDSLDRLASATNKGAIANVDPTLVVHTDPSSNNGAVRKGSDNAIFCERGAEYLELTGTSIKTASELVAGGTQQCLDVASVVRGDPEKISGASKSAAAMRILYQPMIAQCDKLRAQYGGELLVPLLRGMLRAAKRISGAPGEVVVTEDGRRLQAQSVLVLPARADGSERNPGTAERVELKWPTYFRPSLQDTNQAVDAAQKAKGSLVSDETATRFIAPLFGVSDIANEVEQLKSDAEERAAMFPGPLAAAPMPAAPGAEEPDDEGETG